MYDRILQFLVVALFVVAGALWYGLYVQPNDEYMDKVSECMEKQGSARNRQVWDTCHDKLIGEARGLVAVFNSPARRPR